MDPELIDRLAADLDAADYRAGAVRALLGADADDARLRGVFAPAIRALDARAPAALGALIRVFLLGEPVPYGKAARHTRPDWALESALPTLGVAGALTLGLLEPHPDAAELLNAEQPQPDRATLLRAALSLNPVAVEDPISDAPLEWWILSDLDDQLRRGPARADHVMGVGGATRSLIALLPATGATPPRVASDPGSTESNPLDLDRVGSPSSLDLGTGCGIVALHLAARGGVVATDVSERALVLARANARLNGASGIDFRRGDLFAPVAGERFKLIASNPPFVVTPRDPGGEPRYEYRDGGMTGDALTERVIREAPEYLHEQGSLICLANWESHWGVSGLDRVRAWLEASGAPLAAWVIERDLVSPSLYAETWARDGGARPGDPDFDELIRRWIDDFTARRVVALGLGSIRLRRLPEGAPPATRLEHAEGAYSRAAGAHLERAFDAAVHAARLSDAEVLESRWVLRPDVSEHREHRPGQESPRAIALASEAGIARRVGADPLLAAAVGACDGELALAAIAAALAQLLDLEPDTVEEALVEGVRELVWLGMLVRAGSDQEPHDGSATTPYGGR